MDDRNTTTRRALLKGLPAAAATIVLAAASSAAALPAEAEAPALAAAADAELIALCEQHEATNRLASEKWAVVKPLQEEAWHDWFQTNLGKSAEDHWPDFMAHCDQLGLSALEDEADALSQIVTDLSERIRKIEPATLPGLFAKYRVALVWAGVKDDVPREDQDYDDEFLNVLGDDFARMVAAKAVL